MSKAKHFCEIMTSSGRCLKAAVALVKLPYSTRHWECAEHLAESKKEKRVNIVEVV